ncbi:hypothetical protein ACM0JF_00170 [Mycoplasma sp. 654]|uniref:hypothetical protein n=1 Tax=Mycoplasma sp. 654 TaxID=3398773 RepID=UPI003A8AA2AC
MEINKINLLFGLGTVTNSVMPSTNINTQYIDLDKGKIAHDDNETKKKNLEEEQHLKYILGDDEYNKLRAIVENSFSNAKDIFKLSDSQYEATILKSIDISIKIDDGEFDKDEFEKTMLALKERTNWKDVDNIDSKIKKELSDLRVKKVLDRLNKHVSHPKNLSDKKIIEHI